MIHSLRLAVRRLLREPLYSGSVFSVLALTGAALTAVGTIGYAVLLSPLPYAEPEELVFIQNKSLRSGELQPFSPADYADVQRQATTLEAAAASEAWSPVWTGDETAERLTGLRVSGDLFRVLGVPAALGRAIERADDSPDAERVAVISHRLWQRLFGADPTAVGATLRLDGETFTILGVMPAGFEFPTFWVTGVDVWAPLRWSTRDAAQRNSSSLRLFGRLADGVPVEQAQAEISTISEALRNQFPESHADRGAAVLGIQDATVRDVRPVLLALAAGAGLLWLIAIANLVVLAVVRATGRATEAAVRRALGESRTTGLGRQALESALLAVVGSGAGAALGLAALRVTIGAAPRELTLLLSRWEDLPVGALTTTATVAPAMAATIALATAAGLSLAGGPLVDKLRARADAGASRRASRVRSVLTGGEIALAVVLVAAAGLVGKSLMALLAVSPGFHAERVTTAVIPVAGSTFGEPARKAGFYRTLLDQLEQTPGIESAAAVNHAPLVGDRWGAKFLVEGAEIPQPGSELNAAYRVSTPGYFRTIGAQLLEGRDFGDTDDRDAPAVAIVNQTLVDTHLRGAGDVIGSRIRLCGVDSQEPWRTIVGVVADLRQQSWADVGAEIFLPFEQDESFRDSPRPPFAMTVAVRSAANAGPAAPVMRRIVGEMDPGIPLDRVVTLEEAVQGALWQPRLAATLLGGFSLIALLLAGIGVYGAAAQSVARRGAEFGVRMALGATRRDVLTLAVGQNARLIATGVLAGALLAWFLSDLLQDLLYQVRAQDGLVFAGACAALALAGLVASYLPARRAAAIDPARALRQE